MDCTRDIESSMATWGGPKEEQSAKMGNYQEICEAVAAVPSAAAALGGTGHVVDKRTDS